VPIVLTPNSALSVSRILLPRSLTQKGKSICGRASHRAGKGRECALPVASRRAYQRSWRVRNRLGRGSGQGRFSGERRLERNGRGEGGGAVARRAQEKPSGHAKGGFSPTNAHSVARGACRLMKTLAAHLCWSPPLPLLASLRFSPCTSVCTGPRRLQRHSKRNSFLRAVVRGLAQTSACSVCGGADAPLCQSACPWRRRCIWLDRGAGPSTVRFGPHTRGRENSLPALR